MSGETPEIIARAQAGQEEAFQMLVEQHSRSVFRLAYRLTGNEADAEDVVQETFLRVFRKLDGFEARAQFDTWLFRVASNAAMDLLRRQRRHREKRAAMETSSSDPLALPSQTPDPERRAFGGQVGGRIEAAMGRLTEGERAAFTLRHLQGLSIQEIGDSLGLRSNAVKNAIFRAVHKMRQELAPIASEMQ